MAKQNIDTKPPEELTGRKKRGRKPKGQGNWGGYNGREYKKLVTTIEEKRARDALLPPPTNLTEKQEEFCRLYALNGRTHITNCMRLAGYSPKHRQTLYNAGGDLLKMPKIESRIKAYEDAMRSKVMVCVDDVVQYFKNIADKATEVQDFTNANRAMENLAKWLGMFVERKEVKFQNVTTVDEAKKQIEDLLFFADEHRPEIEKSLTKLN